jgi:hypothetical protein
MATGRPSSFTEDIADRICARLSIGESLRSICKSDDMPDASTVRKWVIDDVGGFSKQYTRAREMGADELFESLVEIVDETKEDPTVFQWARLKTDTLKWYLSKVAPRRFSDRQIIEDITDRKPETVTINWVGDAG